MKLRWLVVTLILAACGRAAPQDTTTATAPAAAAAPMVTAVDAAPPGEAADTVEPAPSEAAPDTVSADPPLAVAPPPTVWSEALVPATVLDDVGARAFLATVAREGLARHVGPALVWEADGERQALEADAVGAVAPSLEATLRAAAEGARCRAGICLVERDGRWFLLIRRTATGRVVAGVLRVAEGWPEAHRYATWATEARAATASNTPSLIGEALSAEEGGHYEQAYAQLGRAFAADPDNPWPLYYMARSQAVQKRYREAYVDFRRLCEHPSPLAVRAQLRVDEDEEMARFRTHSAVRAVQVELELPAPDAPDAFAAWLRRFRAVDERLASVIAAGGPTPGEVAEVVEAHVLDATVADEARIAWTDVSLLLRRNALGGLEITAIETAAGPGSAPPE